MTADETQATEAVRAAAQASSPRRPSLASAPDGAIDAALGAMARALDDAPPAILARKCRRHAGGGGPGELPAGVRDPAPAGRRKAQRPWTSSSRSWPTSHR